MRLFLAAWPSPAVLEVLGSLPRPELAGVRWTGPDQWHVTLRFFGELPAPALVTDALVAAGAGPGPAVATVGGPRPRLLGRDAVTYAVSGLDDLGEWFAAATAELGQPPRPRFRGHLTLARVRSARPARSATLPPALIDQPLAETSWTVDEVALVASRPSPSGRRFETVSTISLR